MRIGFDVCLAAGFYLNKNEREAPPRTGRGYNISNKRNHPTNS